MNTQIIILILLILAVSSCRMKKQSLQHSQHKHHQQTTQTRIIERIQPGRVDTVLLHDSIPVEVPLLIRDTATRTQLRLLRTRHNQLRATCSTQPHPIQIDCPPCEQIHTETITQTLKKKTQTQWPWWLYLILVLGGLSILYHLLRYFRI